MSIKSEQLEQRIQAAEEAFQQYDFGLQVSEADAWDTTVGVDIHRIVYGECGGRYSLHVRFKGDDLNPTDVYALDIETGDEIGSRIPQDAVDKPILQDDSTLKLALNALELASEFGGELDLEYYADAKKRLQSLIDAIVDRHHQMNVDERITEVEDYNELMSLLGIEG